VIKLLFFAALAIAALPGLAAAQQVSLQGYFIALSECAANKKKDSDNPGDVHVEKMHAYATIARNATPGTHYQIKIPGAPETESRWVPMSCGVYAPRDSLVVVDATPGSGSSPSPIAPDSIEYLLAASWEPAFCATSSGHGKKECRTETPDRVDATHFSLHGLWPDDLDDKAIFPCYCERGAPRSCSGNLADDATVAISPTVFDALSVVMPGVQSGLQLHEWPKHGSCFEVDRVGANHGATPDEYFSDAVALMAKLNASPLQALFAGHIGQTLTRDEIETAFNDAFGAGASERLTIKCSGGNISELWINLKGDITPESDLAGLILAAPTTAVSTNDHSCNGGNVLAVKTN
jgi:ribonuclease T2